MSKLIQLLAVLVFAAFFITESIFSQYPGTNVPKYFILLKNDQVINGEILSRGEAVQVRSEQGMISLSRGDIALVAQTLQEVYRFKLFNTPQTPDAFVKLADWCVSHQLVQEATGAFDRAILLADHPQQADVIRNRRNAALSMFAERNTQLGMIEEENQKYRQWKEKIPPSTFASFKREILPILVKNCSGIACHSGNSLNEFHFIPNPSNNDIDVAKNLQNVLRYIEPCLPDESPLIGIPISPHGRTTQIFTPRNYTHYEKLYFWVEQVANEMEAYYPLDGADRKLADSEYRQTIPPAPSNNLPIAMPGEIFADNPTSENMPMQNQASSMMHTSMMQSMTMQSMTQTPQQRASFDFFGQQSVVLPGTNPDGWQRSTPANPGLQNDKTVMMTHGSTDDFEQNSVLQQLHRAPVDPFDPVLFNRQYHLPRLQERTRQ